MQYSPIYYIQTNLFCMVILGIILFVQSRYSKTNTTENNFMNTMIKLLFPYCIADIGGWLSNGQDSQLMLFVLVFSSLVYISLPLVLTYQWLGYVYYKTVGKELVRTNLGRGIGISFQLLVLLIISTPITQFAFTLDEESVYHRNIGAYLAPAVCGAAILFSVFWIIRFMRSEEHRSRKDEIAGLLYLPIPVVIASLLQVFTYGLTLNQVGLTVALLLVFLKMQFEKISVDELTGINNRRELKLYLNGMMKASSTESIFLCMIDVDFFKTINDNYGHVEGDEALRRVANVIKKLGGSHKQRLFLARYGGDEFVIAGVNHSEEELQALQEQLAELMTESNEEAKKTYTITLSMGHSMGTPKELGTVENLLRKADERMYDVKKKRVR